MSIADSLFESFGGLALPITAEGVTDNLTSLDPAKSILLNLFASAINSELGSVWTKVSDLVPTLKGTKPVQYLLELPPDADTLQQLRVTFPLLSICRTGTGEYDEYTLFNDRLTQQWSLYYILGPVGIAEERKLGDICVAIAKTVCLVIDLGGHPSYEGGAPQFFGDRAALSRIILKSVDGPGQAAFTNKDEAAPLYYAIGMNLETWEVSENNLEGYTDFQGVDFTVSSESDEGTIPLIFAQT